MFHRLGFSVVLAGLYQNMVSDLKYLSGVASDLETGHPEREKVSMLELV